MKRKKIAKTQGRKSQKVLVAVDFSDSSVDAVRHAVELIRRSGGELTILHVVPADYGLLGIGKEESRDLDKSLQRQAGTSLRKLAEAQLGDLPANLEVRVGRPAEEIIAAAAELKCDLIVLSTHGHTGLARMLIGSVADRVARLAPCPVSLIRPSKSPRPLARTLPPSVMRFSYNKKKS